MSVVAMLQQADALERQAQELRTAAAALFVGEEGPVAEAIKAAASALYLHPSEARGTRDVLRALLPADAIGALEAECWDGPFIRVLAGSED